MTENISNNHARNLIIRIIEDGGPIFPSEMHDLINLELRRLIDEGILKVDWDRKIHRTDVETFVIRGGC